MMQKRLASKILKCSPKRIKLDSKSLDTIKEAITKNDVRGLVNSGIIKKEQAKGSSKVRSKKRIIQKRKGRQAGLGKRKGKNTARKPAKETWMAKIRLQRSFLKELKTKNFINNEIYRNLYRKSKGGFFRSKRHIKLYIDEHNLRQ